MVQFPTLGPPCYTSTETCSGEETVLVARIAGHGRLQQDSYLLLVFELK